MSKIILEVDHFEDLQELSGDIQRAAISHSDSHVFLEENPMTIECTQKVHDKIQKALRAYGSYGGIRQESDIMTSKWNVEGTYVDFKIKKDNGDI